MSIIAEDGTGKADAETYISVADADTYHLARNNTAWAALTTPQKEANLRKATEYMTGEYTTRWLGIRYNVIQALDWPRVAVPRPDYYVSDGVPLGVLDGGFYYPVSPIPLPIGRACAELALRAAAGALTPDQERLVRREKVDVLEVEYEPGAPDYVTFRAIDMMLAAFLRAGGTIPMLRG